LYSPQRVAGQVNGGVDEEEVLWIAIGVVVILIIVAVLFARAQQGGTAQSDILRSAEVIKGDLDITVPASGNVVANQKAALHFDTTGSVDAIEVKVGDG
jgi:multidrug efflux pump subunit AcrA (membrane-fusion protein)